MPIDVCKFEDAMMRTATKALSDAAGSQVWECVAKWSGEDEYFRWEPVDKSICYGQTELAGVPATRKLLGRRMRIDAFLLPQNTKSSNASENQQPK